MCLDKFDKYLSTLGVPRIYNIYNAECRNGMLLKYATTQIGTHYRGRKIRKPFFVLSKIFSIIRLPKGIQLKHSVFQIDILRVR